jgi:hypothetical protein
MPQVFPVQPSYGSASITGFAENLSINDDLSYRAYMRSNAVHEGRNLTFDELSKAEYDSIKDFFIARKQAFGTADYQFYVYDPDEVNEPDLTGASTTGRHTAIFMVSEISFTRDGPCSYSGSLSVLFLD